jgi:hypothetical protein
VKTYLIEAREAWRKPGLGYTFPIHARTLKEAVSAARRQARIECLFDRHDGPIVFARIKEDS